jgi:acyl-CoA reductase-like NAD-dependent aldehyde dehydrogenase
LYVFTENLEEAKKMVSLTSTGIVSINDCMTQIAPIILPFGGFDKSGFGSYRGKAGIETFSHK